MSLKRPAKNQPENFEFNSSSLDAANKVISKYPKGKQQSAVMALLYIAQKQNNNWIPLVAMKYIAKFLEIFSLQASTNLPAPLIIQGVVVQT